MDRKLLLLGPSFFGYREVIAKEIASRGWKVDERSDRPSESVRYKSLYKIGAGLVKGEIERYSHELAYAIGSVGYQVVFFVGGMSFPFSKSQFDQMRASSPKSKFVVYLWDSVANCQQIGSVLDSFDVIFSFEPNVGHNAVHLPLFFTKEFEGVAQNSLSDAEYDACFVGSVHQPGKFRAVLETVDAFQSSGLSVKTHFFIPSRSSLLLRMMQDDIYRRRDIRFTSRPLSRKQIASLYARCVCVIDSPQSGQIGLTMRTIEALGAGRKLITYNAAIEEYDLFSYGDVFVPNGNVQAVLKFARDRRRKIPDQIRRSYSLETWVNSILGVLEG